MYYTLLRSVAPDKPIINMRNNLMPPDTMGHDSVYAYVQASLWESAMAGLNASLVPLTVPGAESDAPPVDVLGVPEFVEAYATACLDLNRLANIVTAFQQAPADVGIVWSKSSKILDNGDPYLLSTKRAFEGATSFGLNVRFITEEQCTAGALDAIDFLVVPRILAMEELAFQATDSFVSAKGYTVRTGAPIPYDERGLSRHDVLGHSYNTVVIRGEESASSYLRAIDELYARSGKTGLPRLIDMRQYPICLTPRLL